MDYLSYIKKVIKNANHPASPEDVHYKAACVFLLIFNKDEPEIVFILKSENDGYPWSNQVALPGGHIDEDDKTPIDAAYRELHEELNIDRHQVEFISSMGHFQTINQRDIEVFTGIWDEKGAIKFDPYEIAEVIKVPIKNLVKTHKSNNYHEVRPDFLKTVYPAHDLDSRFDIWGVTARIIYSFIELICPETYKKGGVKTQ